MALTCRGRYSFGDVLFAFDDDLLGQRFCRAYKLVRLSGADHLCTYAVKGSFDSYTVSSVRTGADFKGTSREIIGYLDNELDILFRSNIIEGFLSVHASSSCISGKTVMCVGLSNAGKTTLSLAIAKIGDGFLGDEYASVRLSDGLLKHERYPVQIKEMSKHVLGSPSYPGLPLLSEFGAMTEACLPEDYGIRTLRGPRRVQVLLFPAFCGTWAQPTIEKLGIGSLPELLMPSVMGRGERSSMFSSIARLLARRGISCYSLRYANCNDAALAVRRTLAA